MKELIKITTDSRGVQLVSALELYSFFGIKSNFGTWCKRMFDYGFEEDKDFTPVWGKSTGGRPSIDYALTLDTAKEIAMIQRSDKGRLVRQYFIEAEKQLREVALQPMSVEDMIIANATRMKEINSKVDNLSEKVLQLEAKTTTRPSYFTIVGYAVLHGVQVSLTTAAQLGKRAATICKQRGYQMDTIPDPRFGKVRMYPESVLKQVFAQAV